MKGEADDDDEMKDVKFLEKSILSKKVTTNERGLGVLQECCCWEI